METRVKIIIRSFFITILIFALAILLNHVLDSLRLDVINDVMDKHEIDRDAYLTEQAFMESFSEYGCAPLRSKFDALKEEIITVGTELGTYSKFSLFRKKDFDFLKRKYFLLEFEMLNLVEKLNDICGKPYLPVLFFYEIGDEDSERQGYILEESSKDFDDRLVIISIDKDYYDEPLVNTIKRIYEINTAPTLILGTEKFEGLIGFSRMNTALKKELSPADPYGKMHNLDYTVKATGINKSLLIDELEDSLNETKDNFARGDILFLLGRLTNNDSLICSSLKKFDLVNSTNPEEMALVYETIASIDCGRNKRAFYTLASEEWEKIGKQWRADIDRLLAFGDKPRIVFNITEVEPKLKEGNYSKMIIGSTRIPVYNTTKIVSQTDRVSRDWLSGMVNNPFSENILNLFSEVHTLNKSELMEEIGWHEGGRIREMKQTGAEHLIAAGTVVAKYLDKWYAPDEKGIFRFEVPLDKVYYPTTRFLRKDIAVVMDTHGVNMIVDQAVSKNASLVIACGDHPAKAAAAKYLSDKGISVVSFPNKFFNLLLGNNVSVLGSPPINSTPSNFLLGYRPLEIQKNDKIVISNSSNEVYALWYYQTPVAYFDEISKVFPLDLYYYTFDDFGQQIFLVDRARRIDADIIATRIYDKTDYFAVSEWLAEDKAHKAILFHSSSYPYGIKMFNDFPEQTTFGDVNPIFK